LIPNATERQFIMISDKLQPRKERDYCPSCRKKWVNHYGVTHICKRLKIATKALCEIQKIASYQIAFNARIGVANDGPRQIFNLIEEAIKKIKA